MALLNSSEMDKLSYEIFSILENKFLFGCYDDPKPFIAASAAADSLPETPVKRTLRSDGDGGKVRILSIDGGIGATTDGLLAGVSLALLESELRSRSGDSSAKIADFFDVAAGSGTGGVLAAMLFTRGSDGKPLFSANEALHFLAKNRREIAASSSSLKKKGIFRGIFRRSSGIFGRMFGEATLRDTVKPVLIPCFDLSTGAPFVFSRADAIETDGYDFKMSQVCGATCADRAVEMKSMDGRTKIVAVGGGVAMENPTSAAITHVLNNKQEFPFANGVEDLLVVSLGSGSDSDSIRGVTGSETPSTAKLVKIASSGLTDTIDQAVAMAFGHNRTSNYVRIQTNGFLSIRNSTDSRISVNNNNKNNNLVNEAEMMLSHRNVESVLFRGKRISQQSNAEKLGSFSEELIKEQNRRRTSSVPTVVIKQAMTPRSSSATISTVTTSTSTLTVTTATSSP